MSDPWTAEFDRLHHRFSYGLNSKRAHAKITGIAGDERHPLEAWLETQHRACHDAPRFVFWHPDTDRTTIRCGGCGWHLTVEGYKWNRWRGLLFR